METVITIDFKKNKIVKLTLEELKYFFDHLYPLLCVFASEDVRNLTEAKKMVINVFLELWEEGVYFENKDNKLLEFYKQAKKRLLEAIKKR